MRNYYLLIALLGIFLLNPLQAQYTTVGSATATTIAGIPGPCFTLTPNSPAQAGAFWYTNSIDLNQSFDFQFKVHLGAADAGADGMVMVFYDPPGLFSAPLGFSGGGMGYQGISPSVGIEMDTYDNGFGGNSDLPFDHITINQNGVFTGYIMVPSVINGGIDIEDGLFHDLQVLWNAATHDISIYFDGTLVNSATHDLVNNVFGGQNIVHLGFTAGTGALSNLHQVCENSINPLAVDWSDWQLVREGDHIKLHWQCEGNLDEYFLIERSSDQGQHFEYIGRLEAMGMANHLYEFLDPFATFSGKESLTYRISLIDTDGQKHLSPLRQIMLNKLRQLDIQIHPNPVQERIYIHISQVNNERSLISLLDTYGRTLKVWEIPASQSKLQLDVSDLPAGMYSLNFSNGRQRISKRIFKN